LGKKPFLSPSSFPQSRGGAPRAPAAAFAGGPGHGGGPGQGEKEGGPTGGRIPSLIRAEEVRGGGATVAGGGGRRRAWGRRHGARRRTGSEGKTERGLRRPGCPTWLGLERSGEGWSAMAGVRERRLWRAAAIGGNGRWRPGMRGSGAAPSPLL